MLEKIGTFSAFVRQEITNCKTQKFKFCDPKFWWWNGIVVDKHNGIPTLRWSSRRNNMEMSSLFSAFVRQEITNCKTQKFKFCDLKFWWWNGIVVDRPIGIPTLRWRRNNIEMSYLNFYFSSRFKWFHQRNVILYPYMRSAWSSRSWPTYVPYLDVTLRQMTYKGTLCVINRAEQKLTKHFVSGLSYMSTQDPFDWLTKGRLFWKLFYLIVCQFMLLLSPMCIKAHFWWRRLLAFPGFSSWGVMKLS